jgi:hypothetical protein
MRPDSASHEIPPRTSPMLLMIAWIVVGVPASWGVYQTVDRSLALFRSPPPPTSQPATR